MENIIKTHNVFQIENNTIWGLGGKKSHLIGYLPTYTATNYTFICWIHILIHGYLEWKKECTLFGGK